MALCTLCVCDVQFKSFCIPGETLEAEARERSESCAVNHSLPRSRREETHAEKQRLHAKYTTHHYISYISTRSCLRRTMTHFCSFLFSTFHRRCDFLSKLFCAVAYLSSQTRTLPEPDMLEGEDAKCKAGLNNMLTVRPPRFIVEPLPLKSPIHF